MKIDKYLDIPPCICHYKYHNKYNYNLQHKPLSMCIRLLMHQLDTAGLLVLLHLGLEVRLWRLF